MYNVFDSFLDDDNWYKGEHYDNQRFYIALSKVIDLDGFSTEGMADYMRSYHNVDRNDDQNYFNHTIDNLASIAGHIKDYRKTISS